MVLWHALRGPVGEYGAMLICTVPGAVYTVYRFWSIRKVQWFGTFLIVNLAVGTLLNVLAGSALQMLWNDVWHSIALAVCFLATVAVKRPLMLYFSLDFVEMQGAPPFASENSPCFSNSFKTEFIFCSFLPCLVFHGPANGRVLFAVWLFVSEVVKQRQRRGPPPVYFQPSLLDVPGHSLWRRQLSFAGC
ncbi:VC0807 family protein [Geobacillus thermoleovorans]|uniref:VC0807 family protein n=1 Tax=Geobacillus thermoleovorans TaxID=33941 RepID=UPI00345B6E4E